MRHYPPPLSHSNVPPSEMSHLYISACNVFPERLWTSFVVLTTVEKERRMRDTIEAYRGGRGQGGVTFFSYIRRGGGRAFMSQLPKQRKQLRKITRESNEKREPSYSARDTQPAFEIINCNGNAHREI